MSMTQGPEQMDDGAESRDGMGVRKDTCFRCVKVDSSSRCVSVAISGKCLALWGQSNVPSTF